MTPIPLLIAAALTPYLGSANAGDQRCADSYGQTLRGCARSLDLLDAELRAGAQQACVEGARLTWAYCTPRIDACVEGCLAAYDRSLGACQAEFEPAICLAGSTCAGLVIQQRDNCTSHAVGTLDACTATCAPGRSAVQR